MSEQDLRKAIVPRQKLFGNPRLPKQKLRPLDSYQPHEWHKLPDGHPLREKLRAEYQRALQPPDPWGGKAA